ncbi:MAG: ArsI/CadI family heavy metal resistance metalloenzyme [Acidobacteriota bacterium]
MGSSVHVSLTVSDLEKSVEFYRGVFGEPKKEKSDYAKFVNADPELHLALRPGLSGPAGVGALNHLGIRVDSTDEVRRWREDIRRRGVVSEEEKREDCCYALQDKFWLTDPDGNRWEVYTVIEDRDFELPAAACCSL